MQALRFRAVVNIVTLAALSFLFALPALAQEVTTTTTGEGTPAVQIEPAVPIVPIDETPGLMDWTYRYLIPTALALALIVILMTSIRYFTNVVRKRYRIVE